MQLGDSGDTYKVIVEDADGTTESVVVTLTVNPLPTFSAWKTAQSLPPGQDNPEDDPDNDGLPNIVEYAFGTNPNEDNSDKFPTGQPYDDNGTEYPSVSYIRDTNVTNTTIVVEAATDLGFQNVVGTTVVNPPEDLGNGLQRVTVRANVPGGNNVKVYFRTKVIVN